MRHIILTNPVSGNHKGEKVGQNIQLLLKKQHIEAELILSEYPTHLTKVARMLCRAGICRFYVVGGDGTLNEVVSGIIGSESEIVVIPCGTGNDFIKTISCYMSMRKIIHTSLVTKAVPTDVIKVNQNRYCINILNAGFDAMVAKNVDCFRWIPFISGKMKYNLAIFYTLLTNKNYKLKLRINDLVQKQNYTLVAISNGKYYGGGICPSPNAQVYDGKLDICAIDATRVRHKIFLLPKYKTGKHVSLPQAHFYQGDKIHLVSNHLFPVSVDGEVFYTNKLSATILPKAVRIVPIS